MDASEGLRLLVEACNVANLHDPVLRILRNAIQAADRGDTDSAIELAGRAAESGCGDATTLLACLYEYEKRDRCLSEKHFSRALNTDGNALAFWHYIRFMLHIGGKLFLPTVDHAPGPYEQDVFIPLTHIWWLSILGSRSDARRRLEEFVRRRRNLMCPAMEVLLFAMTGDLDSHSGPWPRRKPGTIPCSLVTSGRDTVRCETLFDDLWQGVKNGGDEYTHAASTACPHLLNPALRDYIGRYGERAVRHYVRTFLREILGPEVARLLRSRFNAGPLHDADRNGIPSDMVVVPGGRYVIGRGSEHREREAVIAPFLIDRYPVTRKQWQQFVPGNDLKEDEKDLPVANVTFFQANLYARWRGTRLPFEYEWESAASGPRGGLYPWGDTPVDACANCSEMQLKGPSPVGQFPSGATSCGAMDMIGNVSEWVVQDPDREKAVAGEIVKGGRFDLPITVMTCAWRKAMPAMTTHPVVGFRCAKDLDSGA